jgi:PAS domain S-box-containing protein
MVQTASVEGSIRKILIVEDIDAQAFMLRHILEEEGYEVSSADNGQSGLEMTREIRPMLVISGVKIPEMSGHELCRQIRADPTLGSIPVILVTSLTDPNEVLLGLQSGADSFVIKPYERSHMLARVQHALSTQVGLTLPDGGPPAEIFFHGERHQIRASRTQILSLLMSTYDAALQRNAELLESREQLREKTAELLLSNRFLDSMLEHLPIPLHIKDATDLRYVRINRAEENLVGLTREEMLGRSSHDLFEKEDADVIEAQDRQVISGGIPVAIPNHVFPSVTKGPRNLRTGKVPVFGEGPEPTHILGISEDVTQQMELEKVVSTLHLNLRIRNEDLEATNKGLESFTSAASHDLKSPLNVIGGFASLLEKKYAHALDEKGRHYLSVILGRVKSMALLIDDLLAFSKLSSGEVRKTIVDMREMAEQVVAEMLQLGSDNTKPMIRIEPLPTAMADAGLVRQVWVNLLSNAVKYSAGAKAPQIEVTGKIEDDQVVYSVRDNGAGFDMAYYDHLFKIFSRLHTDVEFDGSGVGLATVQRVVTRHGGKVWAHSEIGKGASFHFSLPVAAFGS